MGLVQMSVLIIMQGLPGSGKSTQALNMVKSNYSEFIRVNRDSLRLMLHDGVFLGDKTENMIKQVRDFIIAEGLRGGYTIISDDINLDKKTCKHLESIARDANAHVIYMKMNTSLTTCIERDRLRGEQGGHSLGAERITEIYNQYKDELEN